MTSSPTVCTAIPKRARSALAGPLALAAWGYQASMRARHDELVLATGEAPLAWTSPAELVLAAWVDDPALGVDWSALRTGVA